MYKKVEDEYPWLYHIKVLLSVNCGAIVEGIE